jgi:hypothetical protein
LYLLISERNDALVGGDGVIFHQQLALLSSNSRKDGIVAVLKIIAKEFLTISIDEGIYEVDCVIEIYLCLEKQVNVSLGSTGAGWI